MLTQILGGGIEWEIANEAGLAVITLRPVTTTTTTTTGIGLAVGRVGSKVRAKELSTTQRLDGLPREAWSHMNTTET